MCGLRRLFIRSYPSGRHRGEGKIAVHFPACRVRCQAQFAADRVERGGDRGLRAEPECPRGRVGQAEQLGGQACPELVALAHEQVWLPPLGKGEQVEHGSPRRGITPVGNDPARALGAGRRDVGEGLRHRVVAPVKPGREGGEASRLDIRAEAVGAGAGDRVPRLGERAD